MVGGEEVHDGRGRRYMMGGGGGTRWEGEEVHGSR